MLPPFTGGLHCGRLTTRDRMGASHRAPAVHRRAPLRHGRAAGATGQAGLLLPPFTGGLHCGTLSRLSRLAAPCSRRSPAGSIAAPADHARVAVAGAVCSRRSPAGSIAATRSARQPAASDCSRRSPAGSIAASDAGPVRGSAAPAVHRRAPLRPPTARPAADARRRCSRRSPAGSIAAGWLPAEPMPVCCSRRSPAGSIAASRPPRCCISTLLPPFTGGLHCGRMSTGPQPARCSRRSPAGSIAASPGSTSERRKNQSDRHRSDKPAGRKKR